jgi:hypothetical protein
LRRLKNRKISFFKNPVAARKKVNSPTNNPSATQTKNLFLWLPPSQGGRGGDLQNPLLTNNPINKQQLTINRVNAVFFPADKSKKPGFFKKPGFWRAS